MGARYWTVVMAVAVLIAVLGVIGPALISAANTEMVVFGLAILAALPPIVWFMIKMIIPKKKTTRRVRK